MSGIIVIMKRSLHAGLAIFTTLPAFGEIENEIPLGVEAMTGIRTGYVYRGFELARTSLDFQIEAEIALSNTDTFNFGSWYLSEGDGNFSETGAFIDFRHELDERTIIGASLTYRHFSGSLLDSGVDLGVFTTYQINNDWDWKAGAYYDLGNDAFYTALDVRWSKPISDSAFIAVENGLSYVDGYLNRDGLNDYYGRFSLTYAVSDSVAFTPFVGWNIQLDSNDSDSLHGGLLFEVIF
ncbi:hypothetical protein N9Z06_02020 [Akkermansiaceae bacterium]|nr:hypothetical protein [Akkermansiaceae bacterium]